MELAEKVELEQEMAAESERHHLDQQVEDDEEHSDSPLDSSK